ncbi:MAG: hypothetical protein ACXW6R_08935 [Candidatus Binatia bacterium]
MKQSSTQNSEFFEYEDLSSVAQERSEASEFLPYHRILRILGSMLQKESLAEFEIQQSDDVYTIRGQSPRQASGCLSLLGRIFGAGKSMRNGDLAVTGKLRYSVRDILLFEARERALRKVSSEVPDPYAPSQILRGVGCYLDKREGSRLVSVKVKNRWVTIDYLVRDGRVEKIYQDFHSFYDYGVKMYMQRSNRSKLPPPSDPTLLVTWEARQQRHKLSRNPV